MINKLFKRNKSELNQLFQDFRKKEFDFEIYKRLCTDVQNEFLEGDSDLYIPATETSKLKLEFGVLKEDQPIGLLSADIHEGKKTLWVFSSEEELLNWSKKSCNYIKMKSKALINLAEYNNFEKIIVDNLVPLFKPQHGDLIPKVVREGTNVSFSIPAKPIDQDVLQKITSTLEKFSCIQNIYHYQLDVLEKGKEETNLILTFEVLKPNAGDKEKVFEILSNLLKVTKLPLPLDILWLEEDNPDHLEIIKKAGKKIVIYSRLHNKKNRKIKE